LERLRQAEAIALLADQAATADRDVFVPFFGIPAATYEAPAALALKRNAAIFTAFAVRGADGRYTAEFHRIPHEDLSPDKDGILELTRRHVQSLEDAIRQRPDLWAWQHRRWKHTP
jgi:KDO2-lipid IV(A) lauroyltransferase